MNFPRRIQEQPGWVVLVEGLALTSIIGIADYLTGYDVSVFVLYALPIIFVLWFSGKSAAITICLACAIAWCIADAKAGHPYADWRILVWNTTVQLGFFLFTMMCGSALKFRLDQNRRQVEQLERFHVLARISPVGILRAAADGRCVFVNESWCKITGMTPTSSLSTTWLEAVHPADRKRLETEWIKATKGEEPYRFEARFRNHDGKTRWILGQIAPEESFTNGNRHYVGAITDVTDHRRLEREILNISEREQQRIGQDLHDDLCQFLAATQYTAASVRRDLERRGAREARAAHELSDLLKEAVLRTRNLARTIFPVKLEQAGLLSALDELAATAKRAFKIDCSFDCPEPILIADSIMATHLYRIAQEALMNAVKHGKPQHVQIALTTDGDWIWLKVSDDGLGLAKGSLENGNGMGVRIMEYRAHTIGGTLNIQPRDGLGTVVSCNLRKDARVEIAQLDQVA